MLFPVLPHPALGSVSEPGRLVPVAQASALGPHSWHLPV